MLSHARTDPDLRKINRFTFHPILKITTLFAGIFVTMLPTLHILQTQNAELNVQKPWQFF
jgi:hypothetical protein